jgi:hypothetical protein
MAIILMRLLSAIAALWGLFGVLALLSFSVFRLGAIAFTFFDYPANVWHWVALLIWLLFMAYSFAARLHWLVENPKPWLVVLAPVYAMGFIYASYKRMLISYLILLMVIGFVLIAEMLPAPWRAIMDAGVVLGLSWGVVAIFVATINVLFFSAGKVDPELPKHI